MPFDFQPSNVWFDRIAITKRANECRSSMEAAHEYINDIIKAEKENGIPANRIVVGNGFNAVICFSSINCKGSQRQRNQ